MKDLMEPFPMEWDRQQEHFFSPGHTAYELILGLASCQSPTLACAYRYFSTST